MRIAILFIPILGLLFLSFIAIFIMDIIGWNT